MLKALELIGFKSFADKTRFEFPDGITVVVGPNGSGKSNVVDALKWVLGEQSAKSLRGQEMSDVIFKGTGTGGRKPMNTAEATVVFDNSQGVFPVDAPEVHVTRRVYRSGEGEYLINGKPCRLRDIRDMFRGTGVGVDAYSLIEQGKVDSLLQANAKDRRAIFEEAAGISRFKAKKLEAQRRLERVEQNLLRLSDIVEEVESRLRSVRAQAAKAQRYREYSERLQQLRTQVGVADWRRLSENLGAVETELAELRAQAAEAGQASDALDERLQSVSTRLDQASERLRTLEADLAGNREQISARETAAEEGRGRCAEFAEEAERHRQRLRAMTHRAGNLQDRLRTAEESLAQAESEYAQAESRRSQQQQAAEEFAQQLDRLRQQVETRRRQHFERLRSLAALGNRVSSLESAAEAAAQRTQRAARRLEELERTAVAQATELQTQRQTETNLAEELVRKSAALEASTVQLAEQRRILLRRQQELTILQGKLAGATQRAQVLEELERQLAGLSIGVQELLAAAREHASQFGDEIHGMVADLIEAAVEVAPLVDAALGEAAQYIVISGNRLVKRIESGDFSISGRVGFVRLDALPCTQPMLFGPLLLPGRGDLQGRPGIIGRADRLVRAREPFRPLLTHLLGDTWFVQTLVDALALSKTVGRGLRFVTTKGEVLQADGTLLIGPAQASLGLISRRSELRALQRDRLDLQGRIAQFTGEINRLQENADRHERQHQALSESCRQTEAALAEQRVRTRTAEDRQQLLEQEQQTVNAERQASQAEHETAQQQWDAGRHEMAEQESATAALESEIRQDDERVEQVKSQLEQCRSELTVAQVAAAKSEQRLESLRAQMVQFETDHRERARAIADAQTQLEHALQRYDQTELYVLRLTAELAELYLRKQQLAEQVAAEHEIRQQVATERNAWAAEQETLRHRLRKIEDRQHKQELAANEWQHERNTLATRLREDYGIDITTVTEQEETPEEEQRRAEGENEINDLRNKINRIGAVNLDALEELDSLEDRFRILSGQFQDLTQAKESLERIIHKINADSRRLFVETLETIRTNFQTLYRKAFGGGRADLVLEADKDPLEAGVDIVATPPGKPSFSNSLLSGGEKALTAVALLMSIFQFRPSPFCILDEVDAPFDEANIGRFVDVLKDFLASTKFVIVTHSKKTMTAASTLYGVTMQESGVSKRVSVRFEDVSEDGEISQEAVRREEGRDAA
jgi:chromosome segregation protein